MKQIDECLERFFTGKPPLKRKWQARWYKDYPHIMILFHYQHIILVYDTHKKEILYEWWEVPADKRGLEAAKKWLDNKFNMREKM